MRKQSVVFKDNRDNRDNFLCASRFTSAMFTIFKWRGFGLQACFAKDAKMLKREHFYRGFA